MLGDSRLQCAPGLSARIDYKAIPLTHKGPPPGICCEMVAHRARIVTEQSNAYTAELSLRRPYEFIRVLRAKSRKYRSLAFGMTGGHGVRGEPARR
jgi:hypothetical protein